MSNTIIFQEIVERTVKHYGVTESEILNATYGKNLFRDEAMYICRKITNAKLAEIGKFFNISYTSVSSRLYSFSSILAVETKLRKHITEQIQFYELQIKEKNISEKILQQEAELILLREQKKKISEQLHANKFYSNGASK